MAFDNTYQVVEHSCMYASKRITQQPCHNPLYIIFTIFYHDLYDLSLHDFLSSILTFMTSTTNISGDDPLQPTYFPNIEPSMPHTYLPHMSLTHLNSPLLPPSSHKEKHPHLLTKHVHTTYIQRQAHIITHHTWLTQPLQYTTYLTHPTYMNPTLLSIPHYTAPPFFLTSHKFPHSIVYVYRILPTHVR
jgi:hypothetical protein